MTSGDTLQRAAYPLVDFLVGPFNQQQLPDATPPGPESLESWQVPFYKVALGALQAVAGSSEIPTDWRPTGSDGAELFRELGYQRKKHSMVRGLKAFSGDLQSGALETPLFGHQKDVFGSYADTIATFDPAEETIDIKLPPGTGKTAIIATLVSALKYRENPQEEVNTLILVPTRDLILQTQREFDEFAPDIKPGIYYSAKKDLKNTTVMTYASFELAISKGIITKDMFDVVIKDEVHETLGERRTDLLDDFCFDEVKGHHKIVFGLSATPKTEKLAYRKDLIEALDEGLVNPVTSRVIVTEGNNRIVREFQRSDYTTDNLMDMIHGNSHNATIVNEVLSGLKSGRRVMVRCAPGAELLHTEIIKQMLNNRGKVPIMHPFMGDMVKRKINTHIIRGEMPPRQRRLIFDAFNDQLNDTVDVLLFVDTLKRGFSSNVAKKIIDARQAGSLDDLEQLLGRITRHFTRRDGQVVVGEAVSIKDWKHAGDYTFNDVLSRHAPKGMRYRQGAVVGQGLRDLRTPDSERGSIYEPIPVVRASAPEETAPAAPAPAVLGQLATKTVKTSEAHDATTLKDMTIDEAAKILGVSPGRLEDAAFTIFTDGLPERDSSDGVQEYLTAAMIAQLIGHFGFAIVRPADD